MGDGGAEIVGDGLAHVGESCACAEVCADGFCRRVGEDGDVLARMIGGGPAWVGITAVVGGNHQQVGVVQRSQKLFQPGVEFFQGFCKTFHVFAVAIEHVEIDQIAEDEALRVGLEGFGKFGHAVGVAGGGNVIFYAAAVVDVVDFADAEDGDIFFGEGPRRGGR